MLFFEFLRVGWTVLSIHKFRSALTLISIAIGTFSIVLMSSLANSGTTTLTRGLEDLGGARMIIVFPKKPEKSERKAVSYSRGITFDDVEALRGRVPHLAALTMISGRGDQEVRVAGKPARSSELVAGTQDFLRAFGLSLAVGRGITDDDLVATRRVAVIAHKLATQLFPSAEAALGQPIRVGTGSYRVIGVTAPVKVLGDKIFDLNDYVAVPISVFGPGTNGEIILVTEGAEHNDIVKRLVGAILRDRHNGVDDFEAFDFAILMEKLGDVFAIMHLIAGLIAGVALLAGGIGVMNILLVSVSERVREIGVRKALGAGDHAIGLQFLFESSLLSVLGGALGAGLGCAAAIASGPIIRMKAEAWIAVVSVGAVVAALVASLLIGIFFGLVPARKASKLLVVDCLRAAG